MGSWGPAASWCLQAGAATARDTAAAEGVLYVQCSVWNLPQFQGKQNRTTQQHNTSQQPAGLIQALPQRDTHKAGGVGWHEHKQQLH
jgi:hypothetical protein